MLANALCDIQALFSLILETRSRQIDQTSLNPLRSLSRPYVCNPPASDYQVVGIS